MAENVKLKDLYGAEQTYNGIDTVRLPRVGTSDETVDFFAESKLQSKTYTFTQNGDVTISPDPNYVGLSQIGVTVAVEGGGGGGGGAAAGGVSFIDYDGTVVETWALSDLASKTELPTPPTHDRLVFQQWNWTLDDIKAANAEMAVGALYTTASGLTEFHIRVTKASGLTITCNMVGNKNWGDGTEDALTSHTYAGYGDYIITCDGDTIATNVMGGTTKVAETLLRVYISNSVTSIESHSFNDCHSLQIASMPNSVTNIGVAFSNCYRLQFVSIGNGITSISGLFNLCYSIKYVSIPNSVTGLGNNGIGGCPSVRHIFVPNNVTTVGYYGFAGCRALQSIVFPNSVTSINGGAFSNCQSLQEYDFRHFDHVPTIDQKTFSALTSTTKIFVPSALYDTWVTATNWSTYANYIVGV